MARSKKLASAGRGESHESKPKLTTEVMKRFAAFLLDFFFLIAGRISVVGSRTFQESSDSITLTDWFTSGDLLVK